MTKFFNYLLLIVFCGLMIFASFGLANRGDAKAPMNADKSNADSKVAATYYIKNAKKDAGTDNMVTVILADYRGYDTLGEETVIFTAGLVCLLLLRRRRESE
jgi:multicomponent Na+:H+ antiporter subunit B